MSSDAHIYTGPWINHYQNDTLIGATLTLTTRDSAFLVALLAVVVTTAGTSFWVILSYFVYQTQSTADCQDAVFHQQQAILRNSGTALGAAWKFVRVSYAWRKHIRSKWWQLWRSRTFLYVVLALVVAAVFGVASIFSSQVTKAAGNHFLIHSPNCGSWEFPGASTNNAWQLKVLNDSLAAASYARECYGTGIKNDLQCNTYNVPEIQWANNSNASCPFAAGTCLISDTAAFQMDTGPMDSHNILGLDSKASERVTVRKVSTCAPIDVRPYAQLVNKTFGGVVEEYLQLFMGPVEGTSANWTFEYNTYEFLINIGYDFQTIESINGLANPGWVPVTAFNRTDADVSLFFLAPNLVTYVYPNSDPLFLANIPENITLEDGTVVDYYLSDDDLTVAGCIDQFQFCNPDKPGLDGEPTRCTALSSFDVLPSELSTLALNDYQIATSVAIAISLEFSNMYYAVNGRGSQALKAQSTVFNLNQVAQLPDNQWQIEVSGWFAISLATLQQALLEYATGPTNVADSGGIVTSPSDKYGQAICKRQMIRNASGYQNFSVLGISIILIVGPVLVILSWFIDTVVGRIQKRIGKHFGRLSWTSDGYLQLQRSAYEGAGDGDWVGCADDVPVTRGHNRADRVVRVLNIDDEEHPYLVTNAQLGQPLQPTN